MMRWKSLTARFQINCAKLCALIGLAAAYNCLATNAFGQVTDVPQARGEVPSVEFETGIMPLFSKHGCNSAECHGSATGQADFKLSLFGGDPEQDYQAVVEQLEGRRVNLVAPEKSLLITKPSEILSHGGGEVFEEGSDAAMRIKQWIAAGAKRESTVQILGIDLSIARFDELDPFRFQIQVIAKTNRGNRNVTRDTRFSTNNPGGVNITNDQAYVKKPGRYHVIAQYLNFSKSVPVSRPFAKTETPAKSTFDNNFIDILVSRANEELNIPSADPVDELTFVRRLVLDLTGRLPSKAQAMAYRDSRDSRKKEKLIRKLLASPEFDSYWAYWLRRTIRFRVTARSNEERERAKLLNQWLQKSVRDDTSWAETVSKLVASTGDADKVPSVNYHRFFKDPRAEAESVAQTFLGVRIECANCHNHPLDQWTQEDYHGLAAIFATLKRGSVVSDFPEGTVIQPKNGKPAIPRIPGKHNLDRSQGNRKLLADWISQSELFRHATINRIWAHFLGRGIVEPLDDFRLSNPPVNNKLLKALGTQFAKNGYRFKPIIQAIVTSDLYASRPFDKVHSDFVTGYTPKKLSPEVLLDVSAQVLYREPEKYLATESLEPHLLDQSLNLLKSCSPRAPCVFNSEPQVFGMREKLHFINGDFFNLRISDPSNWVYETYRKNKSAMETLEGFYWRAFARPMNRREQKLWQSEVIRLPTDEAKQLLFLEDVTWSLLNSREFNTIR